MLLALPLIVVAVWPEVVVACMLCWSLSALVSDATYMFLYCIELAIALKKQIVVWSYLIEVLNQAMWNRIFKPSRQVIPTQISTTSFTRCRCSIELFKRVFWSTHLSDPSHTIIFQACQISISCFSGRYWSHIQDVQEMSRRTFMIFGVHFPQFPKTDFGFLDS